MRKVLFQAPKISRRDFERYRGKHVAIFKGRIISVKNTSKDALKEALKKTKAKPEEIALYYIPTADQLIL